MKIQQAIWGIVFLVLLFSACTKDVGTFEEDIPKGNIMMKNLIPQRVSDQMILEVVNIEDYRCPLGQMCSSSGEAVISFKTITNGETEVIKASFNGISSNCLLSFKGHVISILRVSPYPNLENPVKNIGDYFIEVKVEKID